VGTGKHLLGLDIVTTETLFGHICRLGVPGKFDQIGVIRDILRVAFGAAHRSPVPFLVAAHALAVIGTFEPDSPWQLSVEGILVTGGTPGNIRGLGVGRPVVMADEAILENPGVFLVHKPHPPVKVFFLLDDRVVQEKVAVLYIFDLRYFVAKAGPPLGRGFLEHLLDERNHLGRPKLGRILSSLPGMGCGCGYHKWFGRVGGIHSIVEQGDGEG